MVRVNAIVEGRTEERFISGILAPYLYPKDIYVIPRRVNTSRSRNQRGGLVKYSKARADIERTLKHDKEAYCTTMFDYYGLPKTFPGMNDISSIHSVQDRVESLEQAISADINHGRFIPYLTLHEFEALLFSDIRELDASDLYRTQSKLRELEQILSECGTPEEINEDYETAPSRRIIKLYPAYDKVLHGVDVAGRIGIPVMRERCPHFDAWVTRLEGLESF